MTFLLASAHSAFAQDGAENTEETGAPEQKSARSKILFGQPVNVNIAGGGTLPQGKLLTILNASFADKTRAKKGGSNGPDVFSQVWLLKLRYGLTNNIELSATTPYINNERSPKPANSSKHVEGFGDQVVALSFAPWNEHQGDPVSASVYAGVLLPTGNYGKNHLPGNGVWGGRFQAGIGKFFMERRVKLDTEVVYATPFDRGNQKVKRGGQFEWNSQARYLFDRFDIGMESTLAVRESGDRKLPNGSTVNLKNGATEWFIGPSMNVGLDALGMWAGIGVFFPVLQDVKGPSKVEDVRYEFKIGKLW
jgi:hypothetical protein